MSRYTEDQLRSIMHGAVFAIPVELAAEIESMDRTQLLEFAVDQLIQLGPQVTRRAIPYLVGILRGFEHWSLEDAASRALGRIGRDAIPSLLPMLQSSYSIREQQLAGQALGDMGPEASIAVPAFVEALKGPSSQYAKIPAARSLGHIGPASRPALPYLIDALNDSERDLRICAAYAVGRIAQDSTSALDALERTGCTDRDPIVRKLASKAANALRLGVAYSAQQFWDDSWQPRGPGTPTIEQRE